MFRGGTFRSLGQEIFFLSQRLSLACLFIKDASLALQAALRLSPSWRIGWPRRLFLRADGPGARYFTGGWVAKGLVVQTCPIPTLAFPATLRRHQQYGNFPRVFFFFLPVLAQLHLLHAIVSRLTDHHEASRADPWAVTDAPPPFIAGQLKGILGLTLRITALEGKRKLSQNRSEADRAGVKSGLGASPDPRDRDVAAVMK